MIDLEKTSTENESELKIGSTGFNDCCNSLGTSGSTGTNGFQGVKSEWPNYSNRKFYDNDFIKKKTKRK